MLFKERERQTPPPFWGSVASTWLLFSSFFRYILSMLFCTLAIRTLRRPINGWNYPFHPFRCLFSVTVPPSVFLNDQQSIRERKTPSEPADALFWRMNCLCIVPLLNSPFDPPTDWERSDKPQAKRIMSAIVSSRTTLSAERGAQTLHLLLEDTQPHTGLQTGVSLNFLCACCRDYPSAGRKTTKARAIKRK